MGIDKESLRKFRDADLRARHLVDMAVSQGLAEQGEPDDRDCRRFACDVATAATTALIKHIYENDAEIAALREERDRLRDRLRALALGFIPATPLSGIPVA